MTFCEEIQGVSANGYFFLVSYDVCRLTETIEIAVELIFQNKSNLRFPKMNLNNFLNLQHLVLIFCLNVVFMSKLAHLNGIPVGSRPCKFIHGLS